MDTPERLTLYCIYTAIRLPRQSSGQNSVLPLQGTWLQPLVREVPHAMHCGKKKKLYCNKTDQKCINKQILCRILRLKIVKTVLWRNQEVEEGAVKGASRKR